MHIRMPLVVIMTLAMIIIAIMDIIVNSLASIRDHSGSNGMTG